MSVSQVWRLRLDRAGSSREPTGVLSVASEVVEGNLPSFAIEVSSPVAVSADITFHEASVDNTGEMRIHISESTADTKSLLSCI